MKRFLVIPMILTLLFFSCKKDRAASGEAETAETGETDAVLDAADEVIHTANYGYALRVGTSFYVLESDTGAESDKTKWDAAMALGEAVSVGRERRLTFAGDGSVYTFREVRRENGKEGFAFATQIGVGGSLAVVVDERANLYGTPRAVDVTGTILPRKTLVVFYPETERDGMVEIRAYDSTAQRNRSNYIRRSSLSEKTSDIQSSILLQTAEPLKNEGTEKTRKDALLETALRDYPDSAFSADISALANPAAAVVIETVAEDRPFMIVIDDNVNVRALPDPVSGKVVGKLNKNDEVTVSEHTKAESVIDGQSSYWFHITEPLEGWVFGAFLTFQRIRDE